MKKHAKKVLGLMLLFCLTACTTKSSDIANPKGKLVTEISENGTKFFTFHYRLANGEQLKDKVKQLTRCQGRQCSQSKKSSKKRKSKSIQQTQMAQAELHLTAKLQKSGYCRTGYFTLDKVIFQREMQIRGECHEGANSTDKQNF